MTGWSERPLVPTAPGEYVSGPIVTRDAALFTALYELTLAAACFREGMRLLSRPRSLKAEIEAGEVRRTG